MTCSKDYTMRRMFVGLVVAVVLGGGHVKADFTFGKPTNLGSPFNSSQGEFLDCFSADGLELYGDCLNWPGGYGDWDLWVARRPTIDDDWEAPEILGPPVNSSSYEVCACISSDGLLLYFSSGRDGGYGDADLWVTKRPTKDDNWGPPGNLGPIVNSAAMENGSWISSDGLELYFDSTRAGGFGSVDIWITTRVTTDAPWREPINLGPTVNSPASETYPFVSSNGLLLLFSDVIIGPMRPGGFGNVDMWMTKRASVSDPWNTPVNMGPMVNSSSIDSSPRISPDGSMLYFSSERPGGLGGHYGDIYQAPIIPIVDLNRDEIVDVEDMCIMVDHWGESYSLCDIGPTPIGDGIVDIQDLIVLANHLFEEILPSDLIAYWKLDEPEGHVAQNSISNNHGILHGEPLWQPHSGKKGGALEFDGMDDYISTDFVLDPANGAFSVFAWIMGGAPGQAVLSQANGVSWFCTDSVEGCLITELKGSGRSAGLLWSRTIITDGTWHRIGFVWDGSHRILYVDDIAVAEDTQDGLEGSSNGLYIGVGGTLAPNTFWSGLIDDIRIYDRAIRP